MYLAIPLTKQYELRLIKSNMHGGYTGVIYSLPDSVWLKPAFVVNVGYDVDDVHELVDRAIGYCNEQATEWLRAVDVLRRTTVIVD